MPILKNGSFPQPASDEILDDACTLLASLRLGWPSLPDGTFLSVPRAVLLGFLEAAGFFEWSDEPEDLPDLKLDQVKTFLESSRSAALLQMVQSWMNSIHFNELRQVPGLVCEGIWKNDPYKPRRFLIRFMDRIPTGKWWNLSSFIHSIRESNPEFLRTAGEFDSWLIRRKRDGEFLHGFQHWDEIEGELIRYIISGPMHWLGLTDLARADEEGPFTAFRISKRSLDLLNGSNLVESHQEDGRLHLSANGRITIPEYFSRPVRYLVARCSEWEKEGKVDYRYRLTPASLKIGQEQGVRISNLISILEKYKAAPIPPSFARAINRWELNGTEARLEEPVILRLSRPEVLEELRKSKANRFLGEILGPTTVVVKPGAKEKVVAALAEQGLLTDILVNKDIIVDGEKHHK